VHTNSKDAASIATSTRQKFITKEHSFKEYTQKFIDLIVLEKLKQKGRFCKICISIFVQSSLKIVFQPNQTKSVFSLSELIW
jgi:hypothetical protein